ncbi:TrmJ/YjtD family RNA methyltransferase [Candidatus Woesearchaeota archaeon]|nr:MAG: TrmJ/YjtD family RNA methyltransferase [Candidatus Woesearchaeota archaeon]
MTAAGDLELTVALLKPSRPGNLGAVARAMKNFGVHKLLLIEPKCKPDENEALFRATHAQDILYAAEIAEPGMLARYDLVVGLTGKFGDDYNLPRTPLFPDQLAQRLSTRTGSVCLLFGPEADGLTNDDLKRCDFIVTIPTAPEQPSMNLSHSVAVVLYALQAAALKKPIEERFPLVNASTKAQIKKMIEDVLNQHHFTRETRLETQRVLWRRLVGKSFLTQREAMALMGFLRKISPAASRRTP